MQPNIAHELAEIGKIINSANLLATVRKEVQAVMREGSIVLDASHYGANGYRVVVKCGGHEEGVARRIRASIPDLDIDRLADGVLGLRTARRGRHIAEVI